MRIKYIAHPVAHCPALRTGWRRANTVPKEVHQAKELEGRTGYKSQTSRSCLSHRQRLALSNNSTARLDYRVLCISAITVSSCDKCKIERKKKNPHYTDRSIVCNRECFPEEDMSSTNYSAQPI